MVNIITSQAVLSANVVTDGTMSAVGPLAEELKVSIKSPLLGGKLPKCTAAESVEARA